MKRLIVIALERYCLHHPWWYLGRTYCGMATLSWRLNKKWGLDVWTK